MIHRLLTTASAAVFLAGAIALQGASWTPLKNKTPLSLTWPTLLLTDGSVIVLSNSDYQTWMRLTPDAQGSYINGTWSLTSPMNASRLDFASQVLPNGKVWVMGGEYSGAGPGVIPENEGYYGEIFDPVANTWTPASPFPNIPGCTQSTFGGRVSAGSPLMTNILSTEGWQVGWTIPPNGSSIPAGTVIASIDSPSQIQLSIKAAASGAVTFSLNPQLTGNTTAGSTTISGLPSTTGILAGFTISGPGIPSSAVVRSVTTNSLTISANATATATGVSLTLKAIMPVPSCAGDLISMLIPGPTVLTGTLNANTTFFYDPITDTWSKGPTKTYNDRSAEEGWGRLGDGSLVSYDISQSDAKGSGYAERYDPVANKWTPISPSDGTAKGTLPVLSSTSIGNELGPLLRLQDDRIMVIGGNGHTALYTPSTNTWNAGPDMMGLLGGQPFLFAADDAAAAVLPNGHVLMAGDAGNGIASTGITTAGSAVITGIPTTAQLQTGWTVSATGIPSGTTIKSIDSPSQVTISANATASNTEINIQFGSTFSNPVQLFDFDPVANTFSGVSPPPNIPSLNTAKAYYTQMLMLPTGQVLFSDSTNQLYVYTPDGGAPPSLLPAVTSIASKGNGVFTLTGTEINGQSAGAAYGDDEQNDTDFPIISLTNSAGAVYYCRTSNWSYIGVGGGSTPQTVDFTLNPKMPPGLYSLTVSGAGLVSPPVMVTVSSDLSQLSAISAPAVSAVQDAESARTSIVSGQWVAIYGQGLANTTRNWNNSDFKGGTNPGAPLPTMLDGVSVTIGGKAAAVYYISQTQIDVLSPSGLPPGPAAVVVTNNGVASQSSTVNVVESSPSFFSYSAGTNLFPAAVHVSGAAVGDPAISGPMVELAHPGEVLMMYANGLAPSPGDVVATTTTFTQPITITAGSYPLMVLAAALVSAGQFQINVQLPPDIPAGYYPLTMMVPNGSTSTSGLTVTLPVGP